MLTVYIIASNFIAGLISQLIKYIVRLFKGEKLSFKSFLFTMLWAAGPPSTHTTILFTTLSQLVLFYSFNTPIVVVWIMFMSYEIYRIINQRKGYQAFEVMFEKIIDKQLNGKDFDKLKDMLGHDFLDIILGALLGIFIGFIAFHYYGINIKPFIN